MNPLVASWGGGVNSTAMLIGMQQRSVIPDLILFADTGGEKPETYHFSELFNRWLITHGMPILHMVANDGMYGTLENECLQSHNLPSIAYGFKSCSDKYKRRPIQKAIQRLSELSEVTVAIGIDAGEQHRAKADTQYGATWFPLIEWGWDREACIAAIEAAGLPVPIKSACFFCPSSRKKEVLWLADTHPDLFARAVAMERNADLTTIKGLGRRYSWEQLEKDRTLREIEQPMLPCMCFDGED